MPPPGTKLADVVDTLAHGDTPSATGQWRLQPADQTGEGTSRQPLSDLSPAGHLLLPAAIFVITYLTIEFSHGSHFTTTLWPSNAVILAALLRHARTLRNYGAIAIGGACARAMSGLAGQMLFGVTPADPGVFALAAAAQPRFFAITGKIRRAADREISHVPPGFDLVVDHGADHQVCTLQVPAVMPTDSQVRNGAEMKQKMYAFLAHLVPDSMRARKADGPCWQ